MLIIRKEQLDALGSIALQAFEDEMLRHLADFSPPLARAIGTEQLRQVIKFGISRASGHGVTYRGSVRLYLELMLLFGSYFDTDPQYQWAGVILADSLLPQMQRAQLLYLEAREYRRRVAGPDDAFTFQALRNIKAWAQQQPSFPKADLSASLLHQIERIYPEKAAYTGGEQLELLVREGMNMGARLGFELGRETALIVVLMLSFGHGCMDDPLYPWIASTLQDQTIVDQRARAKRLSRRATTWLDHVLASFDQTTHT